MKIQPLGDKLAIEKDAQGHAQFGGILLPKQAERSVEHAPTIRGTVLGAGPKVKATKMGDRVALKIYAGDDYEFDGRHVTIVRERDIVGIIQ